MEFHLLIRVFIPQPYVADGAVLAVRPKKIYQNLQRVQLSQSANENIRNSYRTQLLIQHQGFPFRLTDISFKLLVHSGNGSHDQALHGSTK